MYGFLSAPVLVPLAWGLALAYCSLMVWRFLGARLKSGRVT